MAPSYSSLNWLYDVFVSFRGEDIRVNFLSHVFKELDRKLITAFRDNEIKKSHSLSPELEKAIRSSKIAVVVFSKRYASSSWCLNELLEIVNCKDKTIIPIFYGVDPSHVRKQTEDFGKIFEETCKNNTKEVKNQWKKALTDVANMVGFDSANWDNEAKMIEEIAKDVLDKLLPTSSKDFDNFVGMEDHMAKMSELLQLESEEVRMVGIWGSSGIGKTTIARALFNQLSRNFQVSKFIDRAFVSKSKEIYSRSNPDDHNMKLHLQEHFLSEILGRKDIAIGHLGALGERLQHQKVLIIIDDLDDLMVLNVLADKTQWFGSGSRIIMVTNDKRLLKAHGIVHIYEVSLPTEECAREILCQSAFGKNSPPEGFEKLVVEVARHACSLPLGLTVLGSSLRGMDMEYWVDMLPRLQNSLEDKIEKTLKICYDGLGSEKDQAVFRHIACLFNHMEVTSIKSLLADSNLDVNIALRNLADKSLIHVNLDHVEMHSLLEKLGRKIVRTQSIDKPGKREFLVDQEDVCDVLNEGIGTQKVIGISLDISENHELDIHKSSFKGMRNLRFLKIYSKIYTAENEIRLHLPESFDYWPPKLKLLSWKRYPMSCMPSGFRLENLVKLEMQESKLEKLWEGVVSIPCLKEMDMWESHNLKEIPDLSRAINLEKLYLGYCSSLVELPSSLRNLNKLLELDMVCCNNLETLPTGFNLKSLHLLNLEGCRKLKTFPEFSTNIVSLVLNKTNIEEFPSILCLENLTELSISKNQRNGKKWEGMKPLTPFLAMLPPTLTKLQLSHIPSLVEIPSSLQNLNQLKDLKIEDCINLETLPIGINLKSLDRLDLTGCSRLRSFPEISTNISRLDLERSGIEEVPWRIENFSNLTDLNMRNCRRLKGVSLHISKLKHLKRVDFSDCGALTRVDLKREVEMEADNTASSSPEDSHVSRVEIKFTNCLNLDKEALLQPQSIIFDSMILPGEQVPSYFTHRTTGMSPLLDVSLSQPFFRFRVCAVVNAPDGVEIDVNCQFKDKNGNSFDSTVRPCDFMVTRKGCHDQLLISDCSIPLYEDNAPLAQLLNFDRVDMKILGWKFKDIIKGWGIRLLDECSSTEKRLGYPKSRPPHADTLLMRKSTDYMFRAISPSNVLSYITHRTTGNSLINIPLPHTSHSQPFFRVKVFALFDCNSSGQFSYFGICVSCRFRDRFGNHFDSPNLPHMFCRSENGTRSDVFECLFPLNEGIASLAQLNYDHVDIHFQLKNIYDSMVILREWGIRFFEDCEECDDSDKGSENDQFEECGDSDIGSETDQFEECGDSDIGSENADQFEECEERD
ncbi:Protein VARIATION IN COMPOUND TRIGGERED ROOT growth response [Cardamine amara subsp. amara]|uniref:ADP-ribosyl cyclase/cyclic ADP-ribose hydrolase n=1 Tax=Cardamine amara subsp. amara TaxID=228776 RepID=A0ABD1BKL9_CARAN